MSVISGANNDNNNMAVTNSNLPHIRYCMSWLIRCHKDGRSYKKRICYAIGVKN